MPGYRALLADRPFRRFWLALLLVMLADEITFITLVWHVHETTHSTEAVGWLMVCITGPIIISGLLAGWLLDRFRRDLVMAADAALRSIALCLAATSILAGSSGLIAFFALAALQGVLRMVLLGGAPAAIAGLVAPDSRSAANAMEQIAFAAAGAVGPFLAGQMLSVAGPFLPLLIAAACYAAFAICVRGMRIGGGAPPAGTPARIPWRHSGLLHPAVVIITVMFLILNVGTGAFSVMIPAMIDATASATAATYGTMVGLIGLGDAIGAFAAGALGRLKRLPLAVTLCQLAFGLGLLPIAALLFSTAPPLAWLMLATFLAAIIAGPATVWAQTIRMRVVDPQWHGRAFATLRMIMQSGRPIGGALAGTILAAIPLGAALLVIAALVAIPALAALAHPAMRSEPHP